MAQTFTVGITGQLIQVHLATSQCTEGFTMQIQGTTPAGAPDDIPLASAPAASSVGGPWQVITFPVPLNVTAGSKLAIVAFQPATLCGWVVGPDGGSYAGGTAYLPYVDGSLAPQSYDMVFKVFVRLP
jgi:hypothetical protein